MVEKLLYLCVGVHGYVYIHVDIKEQFRGGQVLSFYHVALGIKLRSFRLNRKNLYPLNHLADPKTYHLNEVGQTTAVGHIALLSVGTPPPACH